MNETDYNARLYEKMKAEQDKYRDWLLHREPSEILNHTYEYTMREDIVMYISGLLADLMNQKPVTAADFADLKGRILLILPDQDFFSGKMQQDLIALMHEPEIAYVSGGHLSTVVKADDYIRTIRAILLPARGNDSAGFSAESSGIEDDKMFCGIRQKFDKSLYIC